MTVAPASRYSELDALMPWPAPDSTATSNPSLCSLRIVCGVAATRFSLGWISFGIPIFVISVIGAEVGHMGSGRSTKLNSNKLWIYRQIDGCGKLAIRWGRRIRSEGLAFRTTKDLLH